MNEIKNLINSLTLEELQVIYKNIDKNKEKIQLLDFIDQIDLPQSKIKEIKELQKKQIPPERNEYFEKYLKMVKSSRTLEHKLCELRINPYTEFEKSPPLFFGMGGGSQALCKGLPFDVLTMILTGEYFRRTMNLGECRILLANRITYTNIPRNKEFSKRSIDKVMTAERDIINLVLKKFGFDKNWKAFLQTDIEEVIGKRANNKYENLIVEGDKYKFVGGHHYSIEMADIYSLVGRRCGGVKLGWFMRNVDKVNGGYIMDEQPFHARFALFMAAQNITNKVTLAYANAGAKLYPGPTGELEKESPYICYHPENRLLLSPYENAIDKLKEATLAGGAFQFKYYRNFLNGIIDLFENLVLGMDEKGRTNRIKVNNKNEFRGSDIAEKADYILKFIFEGEEKYKKVWDKAFGSQASRKENCDV